MTSIAEDMQNMKKLADSFVKRQKGAPCRCEAYKFPHKRYSGACGKASAFSRAPWQPRPLGAPPSETGFDSDADEINNFYELDR